MVTFWERADLLTLVCDVSCMFVTFPCGILGQAWYLIVSILDLCCLSYFENHFCLLFEWPLETSLTVFQFLTDEHTPVIPVYRARSDDDCVQLPQRDSQVQCES